MKHFLTFISVFIAVFFSTTAFAAPTQAEPGCTLAWKAPMIDDPTNPGTLMSQWAHAGDHKGFVFVVRKDKQQIWDKLLEQHFPDPTLLKMACPSIGVEDLGDYSVGITAQDVALNLSKEAWITFRIVPKDNTPLEGIAEVCLEGKQNSQGVNVCVSPTISNP